MASDTLYRNHGTNEPWSVGKGYAVIRLHPSLQSD